MTDIEKLVLKALSRVQDPDLGRDIVSLGFVKNFKQCEGTVSFDIELTTPACPVKDRMQAEARSAALSVPGVTAAEVTMTSQVRAAAVHNLESLKSVKNIVAIASGKGGVGKSTVAVNLALALKRLGAKVGLMDGDIYGPTVAKMLGPSAKAEIGPDQRMKPLDAHGISFMSMGVLVSDDAPVIWRGPMASKMIQQLLGGVAWGDLDYLLIDLPPGTGDIQLTLTQAAPLTGAVIVTTPQDVAYGIAKRGVRMFQEVKVPVLGVVENMSFFACDGCGKEHHIFRSGAAEKAGTELGLPVLGRIPLDPSVCESGDAGIPVLVAHPESASARAFVAAAQSLAARLSVAAVEGTLATSHPQSIQPDDDSLRVVWDDGHASAYPLRKLRADCPCAVCKDEWTGARRITEADVPKTIRVLAVAPVGRYAVSLSWSDGHNTGIYALSRLRDACPCPSCVREPAAAAR